MNTVETNVEQMLSKDYTPFAEVCEFIEQAYENISIRKPTFLNTLSAKQTNVNLLRMEDLIRR